MAGFFVSAAAGKIGAWRWQSQNLTWRLNCGSSRTLRAAIPAAYDAMLTRRMEQAENRIEGYAPGAPPSAKSEAAVRWIGYAMDTPTASAGTAFADAFRHSGAMAELAPFRNIAHHDLDTPETGLRPSVHVLQVVGGLSADATPVASELTILPRRRQALFRSLLLSICTC